MATNPQTILNDDPLDSADNATLTPRAYYGKLEIDAWFCALVKGTGKVPFDPAVHKQRATALDISLLPIAEQNVSFPIARNMIAESREWAGVVLPSIKALGVTAKELNGRFVKLSQVPSGRIYEAKDKQGNPTGEKKEATTLKFLAIYPDEAACVAAYKAETGRDGNNGNGHEAPSAPPAPAAPASVAKPFVAAFARKNAWDIEKTKADCKGQPLITAAVDIESPEFVAIIAEAMAAAGGK